MEPSRVSHHPSREADRPRLFAILLAIGWLLVPAVQYLGTVQRTELQLEGSAALASLATLDLTPFYLALLAATLLFAALQVFNPRRAVGPQPERP